jgi:hypothetical protein
VGAGDTLFADRLIDLPAHLADFSPTSATGGSGTWRDLPEDVRTALLRGGEDVLAQTYPRLNATDYLAYTRTGDRAGFEGNYFARRRMLNALALAECVEAAGRFVDRIVDGVWLLCEESGWQLPAHNSHVRGGGRQALPDPERPVIDLFAAETAAQLAVLAHLLGPALERAAPGLVARIDRELERRLIAPYLTQHFWWMGRGDEPMNNWTVWCTQNVLLTMFCRPTSQDVRRAVVAKAARSLDAFLKDYGEDGGCEEGVLYYRHAGLCLFNAMLVLDRVAPGSFTALWREPKIRNIAEYIVHMHVDGPRYINFADSSAVVDRCGAREFLFGRAVGSATLADFAAADWAVERTAVLPSEINLFYRVQAAFAAAEMDTNQPAPLVKRDVFLPGICVLVARDTRFALAVKAGDNGDSHNHNDVGSVIIYKDGRPVLIDIGVETYTAKTFSPQRYEIWTMQSAYHNLPTFDGVMQCEGEAFAARIIETTLTGTSALIEMDIAGAYPPEARLRSYRRIVELSKGEGITILDTCDGDRPATLSLMLGAEPAIEVGSIVLPGLARIAVEGAGPIRVETIAISDDRLRQAWPERLYRILVPLAAIELRLTIR